MMLKYWMLRKEESEYIYHLDHDVGLLVVKLILN